MNVLCRAFVILMPVVMTAACRSDGGGGRNMFSPRPTEEWTILCYEFNAVTHRDHCEQVAQTLRRTPEIRAGEVWCDHDDLNKISRLYYSRHRVPVDPKSRSPQVPAGMRQDFELVCTLGDDQQRRLFGQARMVPLVDAPLSDRPEWALVNAPGVYSLQIAVFQTASGFAEPRKSAVALVEELRREGYEAYYHHGAVMSMVTVGSFEGSATIKTPEVIAVLRSDPRFEYNYRNGQVQTTIVNDLRIGSPSFLVKVPGKDRSGSEP